MKDLLVLWFGGLARILTMVQAGPMAHWMRILQ